MLVVAESLRDHGMFIFFISFSFLTAADGSIFILLCAFGRHFGICNSNFCLWRFPAPTWPQTTRIRAVFSSGLFRPVVVVSIKCRDIWLQWSKFIEILLINCDCVSVYPGYIKRSFACLLINWGLMLARSATHSAHLPGMSIHLFQAVFILCAHHSHLTPLLIIVQFALPSVVFNHALPAHIVYPVVLLEIACQNLSSTVRQQNIAVTLAAFNMSGRANQAFEAHWILLALVTEILRIHFNLILLIIRAIYCSLIQLISYGTISNERRSSPIWPVGLILEADCLMVVLHWSLPSKMLWFDGALAFILINGEPFNALLLLAHVMLFSCHVSISAALTISLILVGIQILAHNYLLPNSLCGCLFHIWVWISSFTTNCLNY